MTRMQPICFISIATIVDLPRTTGQGAIPTLGIVVLTGLALVVVTMLICAVWLMMRRSAKTHVEQAATTQSLPRSFLEPISPVQSGVPTRPMAQVWPYLQPVQEQVTPLRLTGTVQTIGRSGDNDLVITEQYSNWDSVSRYHATIRQEQDLWVIYDLGQDGQPSRNGVFVDGRRTKKNILRSGWLVAIGKVEFIFYEQ